MPQSLAKLYVHLVFSTKNREPWLSDGIREALHSYMAKVLQNFGCPPVLINSVEDHAHILFELSRTVSISQVVEEVKTTSSKWVKRQGAELAEFRWQSGYGAFAVSVWDVIAVREYIARQREHHQDQDFQHEYRAMLIKQKILFDEKYVWD